MDGCDEVGHEDEQTFTELIQLVQGKEGLIRSQIEKLRRIGFRADHHTALMSLAYELLHHEKQPAVNEDDCYERVYNKESNRRYVEAYKAALKKGYVPPPRVLADELNEGKDAWERIQAKAISVIAMGEEILGRDSTLDAVDREDRISEEAKHKTIVDEFREILDALRRYRHMLSALEQGPLRNRFMEFSLELKNYEFVEQRIDSLQMHLQTHRGTAMADEP